MSWTERPLPDGLLIRSGREEIRVSIWDDDLDAEEDYEIWWNNGAFFETITFEQDFDKACAIARKEAVKRWGERE